MALSPARRRQLKAIRAAITSYLPVTRLVPLAAIAAAGALLLPSPANAATAGKPQFSLSTPVTDRDNDPKAMDKSDDSKAGDKDKADDKAKPEGKAKLADKDKPDDNAKADDKAKPDDKDSKVSEGSDEDWTVSEDSDEDSTVWDDSDEDSGSWDADEDSGSWDSDD